jgi:hypothetical protein
LPGNGSKGLVRSSGAKKRLREDYIVTALYVDDKTEVPQNEWITSKYDGKSEEIHRQDLCRPADLKVQCQRAALLCAVWTLPGNLLTTPKAYDLNVDSFIKFLDTGLDNFQKGETLINLLSVFNSGMSPLGSLLELSYKLTS